MISYEWKKKKIFAELICYLFAYCFKFAIVISSIIIIYVIKWVKLNARIAWTIQTVRMHENEIRMNCLLGNFLFTFHQYSLENAKWINFVYLWIVSTISPRLLNFLFIAFVIMRNVYVYHTDKRSHTQTRAPICYHIQYSIHTNFILLIELHEYLIFIFVWIPHSSLNA